MTPATAFPFHVTPTRVETNSNRPSVNSLVPSSGSIQTHTSSAGSIVSLDVAHFASRQERSILASIIAFLTTASSSALLPRSPSSPTIRTAGNAFRIPPAMNLCDRLSATVCGSKSLAPGVPPLFTSPSMLSPKPGAATCLSIGELPSASEQHAAVMALREMTAATPDMAIVKGL